MNDLQNKQLNFKATRAEKLKLKFMLSIGMKSKVVNYLRYNGLTWDYLN